MACPDQLSDAHQGIRARAREVFAPLAADPVPIWRAEDAGELSAQVWDALVQAGFFGTLMPSGFGGSEAGLLASTLIIEEMAAAGFGSFLPVLTTLAAACVRDGGDEALKNELLPRIIAGQCRIGLGVTEDSGFDVFGIKTAATAVDDRYVLRGRKTYVTGFDVCDYVLVTARTTPLVQTRKEGLPKTHGLSLFLVGTNAAGVHAERRPTRGEGLGQFVVELEDVRVPGKYRLGPHDAGAALLLQAFNAERILGSTLALGATRFCLGVACDHARERRVFRDVPIGAYQAIQHPLADVRVREDALRLMVYRAAEAYDGDLSPRDVSIGANMAKYLASELGVKAVDAAIQTLGGLGFDERKGVIQLWERMRLLRTSPISNELVLNTIAEQVLKLPRSY